MGGLNDLCNPGVPQPESATSGVNALIRPPASPGRPVATPYNQYGMAGQFWAPYNLQCSDMTALIGNDVAGMLFDFAKALDRMTITVYQSAAGEGILGWVQNVPDHLVSGLGKAIYFPYVAVVVILAAIWLAWQGLIRKRGTRTIEGTIWMVLACAAAIWLIGRPADFTGLGKGVSDGISTTLNTAFANLPSPGQSSCLPVSGHDPQISRSSFSYTSSRTVVDQNANELWTVLVCKPWLAGEFGTTAVAASGRATPVSAYARQLLWAHAMAVNELPTTALIRGAADAVLPWALKTLMIRLVTLGVIIYRKPFQRLFAAVGYGAIGARERAEADLGRAAAAARANTRDTATLALPGFAEYRAARWARRNPAQAAGLALTAAAAASTAGAAAGVAGVAGVGGARGRDGGGAGPGG